MFVPASSIYPAYSRNLFRNFISTHSNIEAKQIAISFSDLKKIKNRVLLISGKVGTGKTLLACSILNEIEAKNPNSAVFIISFEKIAEILEENKEQGFNFEFWNQQSAILIENYSQKSEKTQELNLFISKIVQETKSKIILTSLDDEIEIESEKIKLIHPSSVEEIKIIIKNFISEQNIELKTEIIDDLSKCQFNSVREIENFIVFITSESRVEKETLNTLSVKEKYVKLLSKML